MNKVNAIDRLLALGAGAAILLWSGVAAAQYGAMPPPGGMGPGGMSPGPKEDKEEGPAEEAPEEDHPAEAAPTTGYPDQHRRRLQVIEVDGYMRLRTDYMHRFFLGQGYSQPAANSGSTELGKPPFPWPLECEKRDYNRGCDAANLGGANIRLRLEPTINVTDHVRVRSQIDVLDNVIMGSTPDSLAGLPSNTTATNTLWLNGTSTARAPLPPLYTSEYAPQVGFNSYTESLRAKRAWAEVDSELASLQFGRMPWHFGRGILFNDGNCPDCDSGTTVDRVLVTSQIYGHQLSFGYDWGPQGLSSGMVRFGRADPEGYPIDLSNRDDVFELVASVVKADDPTTLQHRIDRGDLVVNYGLLLVYRGQSSDLKPADATSTAASTGVPDREQFTLQNVNANTIQPDLWFKLAWRALTVELESNAVYGRLDEGGPLLPASETTDRHLDIRQLGWVLASELRLYHDSFFVGFETGGATGDSDWDRSQYLNYRWRPPAVQRDHTLSDFKFSPDYHVDEIFFRHILGTVTNAIYVKPQMTYWLDLQETRQLGFAAALLYSLPMVASSTPGNSYKGYGVEMDLGINFRNTAEGFYAGFVWGVFWPFASLDRPESAWGVGTVGSSSSSAQIVRTFLGVRF
jgi:uncharacterized protein (TIGR04551 family)